ncbi:uncharacterized protein PFL1_06194 [Pseudozyma flocculosa PF-1]|uniref:AB hydrolase-1 domain-containing protein n=2 Tax=Pseudozyma flocculosa TaxID=84751 RepID=A0A5C3F7Q5_9BASI|nr:uncharacterized protein PFL1_06194 [Pseudozyma flocculosa PF-1]EPQ26259.1 hypothetical protein PFL1_06194 [Pseudozyma flocculosa PF-1]SPO40220.1 uncharacterized protein PSFLO_05702 [Pseudozyma flocculosa]
MNLSRPLLALLLVARLSLAHPLPSAGSNPAPVPPVADSPFVVGAKEVEAVIQCPKGIRGRNGGVVLLVHGTGTSGSESWEQGPWLDLLPDRSPGFDVCHVTLPQRSTGDVQDTSEWVARAVQNLATKSSTGKVAVVAHSQGNLNVQWALTFWPNAVRTKVSQFIALAADFHGTLVALGYCKQGDAGGKGCSILAYQQATGSRFITTLQVADGDRALAPTASIYTIYDETVTPEAGSNATSILGGASLFPLQAPELCGPLHPAEHLSMLTDPAAFEIGYRSLAAGGPIAKSSFDRESCNAFLTTSGLEQHGVARLASAAKNALADVDTVATAPRMGGEPEIKAYAKAYAPR